MSTMDWTTNALPRIGLAGFCVASITIDRTAIQTVNTSGGRLTKLTLSDRLKIYSKTIPKQNALMLGQYTCTREFKLWMDSLAVPPSISTVVACGLFGVPFSSLQYNLAIQDTYRHFALAPPESPGLLGYLRQKVCPGLFWSFSRAGFATGGGLCLGDLLAESATERLRHVGVEQPMAAKVAAGLIGGSICSLATQSLHNIALVAGRLAVEGCTEQSPHYTTVAMVAAWREMRWSIFYLNFYQRMAIQAVSVCALSMCDIFYRPELRLARFP
mmetsp:Transcript_82857/g.173488  ORF Transcript_82857/g.173488 Transcript_82857/m.173488 type:complete len:272 (+) Transcript_82857:107-922(+)|eukprot:CAMPEP_0206427148 /NCGR_PEP_ID=MMETSP0324_2-20121206/4849_1 /ASSEMBLY_ACC=CAM_ASM_000836 /TAXON_ID=2866 /ORGANISM="Crypthecodinium cohnii, Strain Seligo" /LENGTH=271 /DNA_ID=CAMNT_0053892335 /DNA_START=42 /DNA_END=857 /DNA_ORIENTATION=+